MKTNKLIISLLIVLNGCQMYQPEKIKDEDKNIVGKKYNSEVESVKLVWWESLNNEELNHFINAGLNNNFSIKMAWSRLRQAEAIAKKVGVKSLPSLGFATNISRARSFQRKGELASPTAKRDVTTKNYSVGLVANYEIDLWGRIQSEQDAVKMDLEATQEDINSAKLTLSASIAKVWTNIISTRNEIDNLKQNLVLKNKYLQLLNSKYKSGSIGILSIFKYKQVIIETEKLIEQVKLSEELLLKQMNSLLGKNPSDEIILLTSVLPKIDIEFENISVNLLKNRPDIIRQWKLIKSAQYSKAMAKADKLPRFTLSASFSNRANQKQLVFSNWIANLAAGLTGPLFDGGLRDAEIARQKAIVNERLNSYKNIVLNAVKEVEDSIANSKKIIKDIDFINKQKNEEKKIISLTELKYKNGSISYLNLLEEQMQMLNYDLNLLKSNRDLLKYQIDFYKAIVK